jgi:ABC-type multidrug transport system ATPase subunit
MNSPAVRSEALLTLSGVGKTYQRAGRDVRALHDFTASIEAGEIVGLLGPNGSGKTTFVKLVTGISAADQGSMRWRGKAMAQRRLKDNLREIGVLLEGRGASYERLSTLENARYFCGLREASFDRRHFDELAVLLEIPDVNAPLRQLSTGNKLRAALLGCLIHRPALALLDEPTLGLDLFGVDGLEKLLRHGAKSGTAFLVSSHDIHFIERLCPRIICIRQGLKVFDGPKAELLSAGHEYMLKISAAQADWLGLRELAGLLGLAEGWQMSTETSGQLPLRDYPQVCAMLAALQARLPSLLGLELKKVSLHDKYRSLIGEGG